MKWFVTKAFDYSQDGIKIESLALGTVKEIREDLVSGLKAAGYIRQPTETEVAGAAAPAPAPVHTPAAGAPSMPEAQLDRLSKEGLLKLAAERGIAIQKGANKDAILAALKAPAGGREPTEGDLLEALKAQPDFTFAERAEGDLMKVYAGGPWPKLLAVVPEAVGDRAWMTFGEDGTTLSIAVANGAASYVLKDALPNGTKVYELTGEPTYEAAPAE